MWHTDMKKGWRELPAHLSSCVAALRNFSDTWQHVTDSLQPYCPALFYIQATQGLCIIIIIPWFAVTAYSLGSHCHVGGGAVMSRDVLCHLKSCCFILLLVFVLSLCLYSPQTGCRSVCYCA